MHVIENENAIPFLGLKEPVEPPLTILGKLEQEFLLATAMGDVPCMTGYVMPICSCHAP
jgi:hypothetical protein